MQTTITANVRVLVADDNWAAAVTLAKILKSRSYSVRAVSNGAAAIEELHDFQPDVVLLDIGMPGIDGHEVTRQIRKEPGFESVMIVIISGRGEESDKAKAVLAGADYYLVKPVDPDELWAILAKAS